MASPLITADEYTAAAAAAGKPVSTAALAALADLIGRASEAIESYSRREFSAQTVTEVLDGDRTNSLILRTFPVQSITSINIHVDTDSPETLDPSSYRLNKRTGEVRLTDHFAGSTWDAWGASGVFPEGWQNIEVVYQAGFTEIPGPVKDACILTLTSIIDNYRRDNNVDSERWEDYGWTRNFNRKDAAIPETAKDFLAPFRDHRA